MVSKYARVYVVTFIRESRLNDPLAYLATGTNWQRALKMASDMYAKDHKGDRIVRADGGLRAVVRPGTVDDRKLVEAFGVGSFITIRMRERATARTVGA
jgi:hypothetical protein